MTREKQIAIMMADRYSRKEAEEAITTDGFLIYDDLEQAAEDFDLTVEEISKIDAIGLHAVEYDGQTYIISYPM